MASAFDIRADCQRQQFSAHKVNSIDDAMLVMPGWDMDLLQMSPGRITYSLSVTQLDTIQIFHERTDKTLLKRGLSWPGSLVLSFVLNAEGNGWLSGHEVDPEISLMVDGQFLPEILTPHTLDLVYIAIDRQWLADQLGQRGHERLAGYIRAYASIAMWHSQAPAFTSLFSQLLFAPNGTRPPHKGSMESSARDFVTDILLTVITSARKIEAVSDTNNKLTIDKARRLMFRDISELPTVSEVAAHLGISRRHLQTCFNNSVGLPATEFIRAERLNMVRKALIRSRRENRHVVIGDIAAQWGFWHLSRFAADYREMFAELPSETLRPGESLVGRSKTQDTSQNG
ncbi:AraC family transcriptional regulator, ethanolamine operon transcriptional activator [Rhizobium sp. RU35A]|uniref:helix-turn-helix domain-containing protein n=1 Tax=Rhizobium sp. RU35A TaxID=1907414 RepID=UPI000955C6FA|nr:helix-turn-helix domain-containing protein [Rhizobium sp. RU35A]SIQ30024.1 AraC family transcriptional regulator, ethanolamine operon transcriptional activator [Rhizobium sp. RU35A]